MLFSRRGAQGIGQLIIFIAIIFVASISAGVVIEVSSSLETTAVDVGNVATEKITSQIEVVQIEAVHTNNLIDVDSGDTIFNTYIRLGPGSSAVKFDDFIVRLNLESGGITFQYNSTIATPPIAENLYSVIYRINGTNHRDGYIVPGDLIELAVYGGTSNGNVVIETDEQYSMLFVHKAGAVQEVDLRNPGQFIQNPQNIYP